MNTPSARVVLVLAALCIDASVARASSTGIQSEKAHSTTRADIILRPKSDITIAVGTEFHDSRSTLRDIWIERSVDADEHSPKKKYVVHSVGDEQPLLACAIAEDEFVVVGNSTSSVLGSAEGVVCGKHVFVAWIKLLTDSVDVTSISLSDSSRFDVRDMAVSSCGSCAVTCGRKDVAGVGSGWYAVVDKSTAIATCDYIISDADAMFTSCSVDGDAFAIGGNFRGSCQLACLGPLKTANGSDCLLAFGDLKTGELNDATQVGGLGDSYLYTIAMSHDRTLFGGWTELPVGVIQSYKLEMPPEQFGGKLGGVDGFVGLLESRQDQSAQMKYFQGASFDSVERLLIDGESVSILLRTSSSCEMKWSPPGDNQGWTYIYWISIDQNLVSIQQSRRMWCAYDADSVQKTRMSLSLDSSIFVSGFGAMAGDSGNPKSIDGQLFSVRVAGSTK